QLAYTVDDCGIRLLFTDHRRGAEIASTPMARKLCGLVVTGPGRIEQRSDAIAVTMFSELEQEFADTQVRSTRPIDSDLGALLY
ncbi:hypothetical protein OVW19_29955, partial [Klebsiella pneumoniae]|uniref:hypothetical protein n=1 Tax=Klebsiella pneumoniae TaxID=573 RepID=UPI00226FA4CE